MYCPRCGTQTSGGARFCHECGAETSGHEQQAANTAGPAAQGRGVSPGAPPFQGPFMTTTHVVVKHHSSARPWLIAIGLLLLLPLAVPLIFGTLLAGLFAGVAVVGIAVHAAPLIAVALLIYLVMTRQQRMPRSWR